MKDFKREDLSFSLCGLNCGLCPMNLNQYCPGCGGTRAVILLLEGHPILSFLHHPVVLYAAVLGGWYLISNTIAGMSHGRLAKGSSYHHWYGIGAAILVAANWVIRNLLLLLFHITL